MTSEVWCRKRIVVNTDPQRRVYNGCNFSEREVWTEWKLVAPYASAEDAQASAATFKEINPTREYEVRS